ncbi:MAG TPA: YihY/virulence factor BrkB family protein [Gemmatimonadaceae bacterium]|jgi:membrane protein|nr:YihY/virulence factor BrkB family protein [Gemmatimonadaceae bacterium]
MIIAGYRLGPLLKKTAREVGEDNVTTLAASAAYNFFFSLFPLLLFLAPLLSLVGNKQQMLDWLMAQLMSVLPSENYEPLHRVLDTVIFAPNAPGLMSVGLLLAAWSGSNVFGTLMGALNTAYDVRETRSWIRQQIIRLVAFAAGGLITVVSTVVFLDGEAVLNWIGDLVRLGSAALWTWKIVQFPLAFACVTALAFMTFYLLPNVKQRKGQVLAAAIVTTLLWVLATLLFRVYLNRFPPNQAYGLIGGIIILLTWMYYTMFVVLIGGELASELHHGTGAVDPDKGAVYLGRVVTGRGSGSSSGLDSSSRDFDV